MKKSNRNCLFATKNTQQGKIWWEGLPMHPFSKIYLTNSNKLRPNSSTNFISTTMSYSPSSRTILKINPQTFNSPPFELIGQHKQTSLDHVIKVKRENLKKDQPQPKNIQWWRKRSTREGLAPARTSQKLGRRKLLISFSKLSLSSEFDICIASSFIKRL